MNERQRKVQYHLYILNIYIYLYITSLKYPTKNIYTYISKIQNALPSMLSSYKVSFTKSLKKINITIDK